MEPTDQNGELDVNVGPTGVGVRTKGYRIGDLTQIVMAGGIITLSVLFYVHNAGAEGDKKSIADANLAANRAIVEQLKESNKNTLEAIKELATEQRRSTAAMRETNCLITLPETMRKDRADFCKRMSRDQ